MTTPSRWDWRYIHDDENEYEDLPPLPIDPAEDERIRQAIHFLNQMAHEILHPAIAKAEGK